MTGARLILALGLGVLRAGSAHALRPDPTAFPHRDGQVIVRFKPAVSMNGRRRAHAARRAVVARRFGGIPGLEVAALPPGTSVREALEAYGRDPDVLYVEPNFRLEALSVPDDPQFPGMWGLDNRGQTGGTPDADIDAPEAWDRAVDSVEVSPRSSIDPSSSGQREQAFEGEPCVPRNAP